MFRGSEFRVQEANAQPNTDVENQPWTKPLGPCTGVDTDGHYYGEDTAPVFVCPNVTDLYRVGASLVPGRSQYYYELSQPLFTVWGNQPTTEDYAHLAYRLIVAWCNGSSAVSTGLNFWSLTYPTYLHFDGGNILFADAHAELVPYQNAMDLTDGVNRTSHEPAGLVSDPRYAFYLGP